MTAATGSFPIGPENGQLTVSTYVGGMGAKMGHDLVLRATRWTGTAVLDPANPAGSNVQVSVDASSLEVVQATGGIKPLTEKDKGDIAQNQEKTLQYRKFPDITFQSTTVSGIPPSLSLQGNLTIMGNSRPVTLDVTVEEGSGQATLRGQMQLKQTDFGVKPYSKMGALKVKDEVDIRFSVVLPISG